MRELPEAGKLETVLEAVTLFELLVRDIPPREYLLSPLLPRQSLTMIYSTRGLGKTFMAIHMAYAIATGGRLFDWEAPNPSRVLYLDGEMPAISLQERFAELVNADPRLVDHLNGNLRIVPQEFQDYGMPDLASIEGQHLFNELVDDIDVIFVDNISTLCRDGAENNSDDWTIVANWALEMRRLGKSVVFIHHAGKGGQQRGTSKREDILDVVLSLRKTKADDAKGASFEVHFEKKRHLLDEQAKPFVASLVDGRWRHDTLEDDTVNRVLRLKEEGLNQSEIAIELDVHKSTVSRALKRANASDDRQEKKKC